MSERDELHYSTTAELENTVQLLQQVPGIKIEYEKGTSPSGWARVYWKSYKFRITTNGIVDIYASRKDLRDAVEFIEKYAVDRNGRPAVWAKPSDYLGKGSLLKQKPLTKETDEPKSSISNSFNETFKVKNLRGNYVERAELREIQPQFSEVEDTFLSVVNPDHSPTTFQGGFHQAVWRERLTCKRCGHRNSYSGGPRCANCGANLSDP
jgi:hypothetical protein